MHFVEFGFISPHFRGTPLAIFPASLMRSGWRRKHNWTEPKRMPSRIWCLHVHTRSGVHVSLSQWNTAWTTMQIQVRCIMTEPKWMNGNVRTLVPQIRITDFNSILEICVIWSYISHVYKSNCKPRRLWSRQITGRSQKFGSSVMLNMISIEFITNLMVLSNSHPLCCKISICAILLPYLFTSSWPENATKQIMWSGVGRLSVYLFAVHIRKAISWC